MSTVASSASLTTHVLDSAESFDKLHDAWLALHDASNASVFSSWEWQSAWWRFYGKGQPLRIITVYQGDTLVGIAPLYVQKIRGSFGASVRALRWVGVGGDTAPDDLGPILAPATAELAGAALCEALFALERDWDVMLLTDLDESAAFFRQLQDCARRHGHEAVASLSTDISFVDLPKTWDEYLGALSGDRRYAIRNTRRKAEKNFNSRFVVVDAGEELDKLYDQLVELHKRRWTAAGVAHAFSTPEYVGFHRDAVRLCADRGWIRFYALLSGDQPIAMFYCYRFRQRIFYFQAGFDPQFQKARPGLVLMGHAIEQAIGDGNEIFDYLRGDHEYKTQWGKGLRRTGTLTVYGRGFAAFAYRTRFERIPALKEHIKQRAPGLVTLRRRLRGGPASDEHA